MMLTTTGSIGERLLELRKKRGLKRQALSDELGVMFPHAPISRSALEQLEKGVTEPRASTILRLTQFFNVSADYLLTGASSKNLKSYRELGLTDTAIALWESQIDLAQSMGKFTEFSEAASTLMSDLGFFNLFWGLINLNRGLAEIDAEIKKVLEDNPNLEDAAASLSQDLLFNVQLSNLLTSLQERRDLLRFRYRRQIENVFENLMAREDNGK